MNSTRKMASQLVDLADEAFQVLRDWEEKVWADGLSVDLPVIHDAVIAAKQLKDCACMLPDLDMEDPVDSPLTVSGFLRDKGVEPLRKSVLEFGRDVAAAYRQEHGMDPVKRNGMFVYRESDRPLMEETWRTTWKAK